ncbi:MAG: DNA-formamidopyrimidine glycosylase, partial [Candidatus Vogelbacteria bacterium]|nr:DNA-formamidopyrimidine glycosylase [Candidatus Vogelbacteria bacterium]
FNDLRRFGWLKLLDPAASEKVLDAHGIEPLGKEFSLKKFEEILARYPNRKIKQLLLDQTLIAGLGNIYVDEAGFRAKVLPWRQVRTLTARERSSLYRAIVEVLKLSLKKKGTSARNYLRSNGRPGGFGPHLNVYGRAGQPCKVCATPIKKVKQNGRGTHFCPKCQK